MDGVVDFGDIDEVLLLSKFDAFRIKLFAVILEVIDRLFEIQKLVAAALGMKKSLVDSELGTLILSKLSFCVLLFQDLLDLVLHVPE